MSYEAGSRRTVTGSDGTVKLIEERSPFTNETYEQLKKQAVYFSEKLIDKYELLDNAYRASGGFENGTYLIPHPSERVEKYVRRQRMAYYVNYIKPIIDAIVNPIFKTEPIRTGMSDTFSSFIKDVDGNDTTLTRFMKKAAIRAKLHGVEFVVVDMEPISQDKVITEKMIKEERLYPYLYLVSPAQVTNWATNKFGKLEMISYNLKNTTVDVDGNTKTINETWTWTEKKCKKVVDGNEITFENPIGIIPILPLYGAINDSNDLIVASDMLALAKTSFSLYQALSELRERNRSQAFSLLTYPIADDDDYSDAGSGIQLGTADMLLYRASSSNRPEYVTPPPDSSNMLLSEIEFMVKEMYRMASLRMSTDKNTYNVSAIARKIENQQYYQSIAELAQGIENVEKKISKIFNLYMGDKDTEYTSSYTREYAVLDVTEILNSAVTSLSLGMPSEYNKEMRKQIARATLSDVGTGILDTVLESVEKMPESGNPLEEEAKVVQTTRT